MSNCFLKNFFPLFSVEISNRFYDYVHALKLLAIHTSKYSKFRFIQFKAIVAYMNEHDMIFEFFFVSYQPSNHL